MMQHILRQNMSYMFMSDSQILDATVILTYLKPTVISVTPKKKLKLATIHDQYST